MIERELVNKIQKWLKEHGYYCIKTADKWTSGIPDLVVIGHGKTLFLEVKRLEGKVSAIQNYTIMQINIHGGEAYIVKSLDDVKNLLDKW